MRFTIAAVAATLAATAQARIAGIAVPDTIKAGDKVDLHILSEGYIQTVDDVAVAFGYADNDNYPDTINTLLGSFYLGPGKLPRPPVFHKST